MYEMTRPSKRDLDSMIDAGGTSERAHMLWAAICQ